MYKLLLKPFLFLFSAETSHQFVYEFLKVICIIPGMKPLLRVMFSFKATIQPVKLGSVRIPNRVGLAAGFDKNAVMIDELACFGFGFIEIGTVTPLPQDGNPKPRIFRLKKDKALINRMGFNNDGVEKIADRLRKRNSNIIVGANIGKNKITPNEEAVLDYITCFIKLFRLVDFFVINVSSPNTPDLRDLQAKKPLLEILNKLQSINMAKKKPKPILVKISPDLNNHELDSIIDTIEQTKITGIIATNTTVTRDRLYTNEMRVLRYGDGGLSGTPLKDRSTEVIHYLSQRLSPDKLIIGSGGVNNADSALEKLRAGASLVEVYTGFIYEGPGLIKHIVKEVDKRL